MIFNKQLILAAFLMIISLCLVRAQRNSESDREKITTVANAYIESIYEADTTKVHKYIDPELFKKGIYYSKKDKAWSVLPMTFEQLVNTARNYNRDGTIPKNAPKVVKVLDTQEKIANVKIEAIWGIDYLLMIKDTNGKWKVSQILWQSYSPE